MFWLLMRSVVNLNCDLMTLSKDHKMLDSIGIYHTVEVKCFGNSFILLGHLALTTEPVVCCTLTCKSSFIYHSEHLNLRGHLA